MNAIESNTMRYSVIVFLEEHSEDFVRYLAILDKLFSQTDNQFEFLIVANGTEGFFKEKAGELERLGIPIKCIAFNRKTAAAICLKVALGQSSGEIVFVTGSYQQIADDSIRDLLGAIEAKGDVINPWRQDRIDPWLNRLQSTFFNWMVRKMTRSKLHDLSCTSRVFRRSVLEDIDFYGGMYRFLPILAAKKGYKNVEVKCKHFQERGKVGFYGFSDYLTRLIDICTLYFGIRFSRKPLRFFSSVGLIFLIVGLLTFSYVFVQKIFWAYPIGGRPVLLLAILFMVLGAQAVSVGLLAEIVAFTHGRQKKEYSVEKQI
jgi:hypothetical protein